MASEIVSLPDHRMENDFSPHMPYTLGYSATPKSTDSLTMYQLYLFKGALC